MHTEHCVAKKGRTYTPHCIMHSAVCETNTQDLMMHDIGRTTTAYIEDSCHEALSKTQWHSKYKKQICLISHREHCHVLLSITQTQHKLRRSGPIGCMLITYTHLNNIQYAVRLPRGQQTHSKPNMHPAISARPEQRADVCQHLAIGAS